jgi:hypothetical protein
MYISYNTNAIFVIEFAILCKSPSFYELEKK